MDPQPVSSIASTLQTSGGWGLSALLMMVIFGMARYIIKMHEDKDKQKTEQNDKTFAMLEKKIESEQKHAQSFTELSRTIEKLIERL